MLWSENCIVLNCKILCCNYLGLLFSNSPILRAISANGQIPHSISSRNILPVSRRSVSNWHRPNMHGSLAKYSAVKLYNKCPCWFELNKLFQCSWYKLWKILEGSLVNLSLGRFWGHSNFFLGCTLKAPKGFSKGKLKTHPRPKVRGAKSSTMHIITLHYSAVYLSSGLLCEKSGAVVPGEYGGRPGGGGGTQERHLHTVQVQCSDFSTGQITGYSVPSAHCRWHNIEFTP